MAYADFMSVLYFSSSWWLMQILLVIFSASGWLACGQYLSSFSFVCVPFSFCSFASVSSFPSSRIGQRFAGSEPHPRVVSVLSGVKLRFRGE